MLFAMLIRTEADVVVLHRYYAMTGNSSKDDRKYVKLQNSMVSSSIVPFPG
jgi:hypothetical protein